MKKVVIALVLISTPAIAEVSCDYSNNVETNWTHHIQKTNNIKRDVITYIEDTRKCMVTADVKINGVTYPASGDYVFGPDMAENDACDQALIKAKKETMSIVSTETLSSKTKRQCTQKKPVVQPVATPIEPTFGTVIETPVQTASGYTTDPFFTKTESPATGLKIEFQTNLNSIFGAFF
tara:strand:+ start:8159 stop:8695 length:537 start_codon:yes stop_codon:yes gene_type:complete